MLTIESGLRLISGECRGLVTRWRHGRAEVGEGRIVFRRFIPPGIRVPVPFVAPVEITVIAVQDPNRDVGVTEAWSVNPGANILRLELSCGVAEWAVLDRHLDQALAALGSA